MTKTMAQRRALQLRKGCKDEKLTFEAELRQEGSSTYVVRQYRNDQPTGTVYHI